MTISDSASPVFIELEGIKEQSWSLLPFELKNKEQLLVGTSSELFSINKKFEVSYIDKQIRLKSKKTKTNYIQKLTRSKTNPNEIFVALR